MMFLCLIPFRLKSTRSELITSFEKLSRIFSRLPNYLFSSSEFMRYATCTYIFSLPRVAIKSISLSLLSFSSILSISVDKNLKTIFYRLQTIKIENITSLSFINDKNMTIKCLQSINFYRNKVFDISNFFLYINNVSRKC